MVLEPPVSIKKSMSASHLISMEDGRPYKSLKRHLTARGLTPAQYREKWSLPLGLPYGRAELFEGSVGNGKGHWARTNA